MCPFCKTPKTRALCTERYSTFTRRRRRCVECGGEWFTQETFHGVIKAPAGRTIEPQLAAASPQPVQ